MARGKPAAGGCGGLRALPAVLLRSRFVRFLLVGCFNTLFGYGCYAAFLFAGLHYSVASLLATVLGVLMNFRTVGHFVFSGAGNRGLARFVLVYVLVYFSNLAGLAALARLGVGPYWAGAALVLPMALLSYFLNKAFVFKNG